MSREDLVIVWTAVGDRAAADDLADRLVDAHLAACVQIVSGLTSVYRWQGRVERSAEFQLAIKARADAFPAIEALLREHHPYDVPEIVAAPVVHVSRDYRAWLLDATSGGRSNES